MQYVNASSAAHALQELIKADGEAVILAGGSDLIVDTKAGKIHPQFFIDVTKASDMIGIEVKDGALVIGAATTLTEITRSPLVKKYYPSLAEGCGAVGSLQIRNSATLVGNVVTAQPAADGAMALSPLGAVLTVLSADGETQIPMEEMYAGIARSRVDHGRELVTKITIPLPEAGEAAAYSCLELRKSLALPMLSCAAMVHMESGCVVWSRIRIAPVGVGPVCAAAAELYLEGRPLNEETMAEAGRRALENANPRSNPLRGSREYRLDTLPVLVRRTLSECKAQLV